MFHHRVRFRWSVSVGVKILRRIVAALRKTPGEVILNRYLQVTGAPVMQEEQTLPESPQWSRAELIGSCVPLHDVIGQRGAHVVNQQIREEIHRLSTQGNGVRTYFFQRRCG